MEEVLATNEIGIKAKSKYEIYRLLATDGNVYLPPQKEADHYYLSKIICGETNVNKSVLFIL